MPRIGRHPLKVKGLTDRDDRAEITFATITHVPTLEGYWEESLEVLDVFFSRVRDSTRQNLEVIVFDNNSCERVRGFLQSLQDSGLISCLVLSSRNLRKLGRFRFSYRCREASTSDTQTAMCTCRMAGWKDRSRSSRRSRPLGKSQLFRSLVVTVGRFLEPHIKRLSLTRTSTSKPGF